MIGGGNVLIRLILGAGGGRVWVLRKVIEYLFPNPASPLDIGWRT